MQIRLAQPTDGGGIGRVHVETWRTTCAGIVPADYLAQLDAQKRGEFWENFILKADPDRRLVSAGAEPLLKMGLRSMLVWVLAANENARRAYEAMDGTPIGSKVESIGGTELEAICYGWSDISGLASGGRES